METTLLKQQVNQCIKDYSDEIISLGEAIFACPETGFKEFKTAELIAGKLRDMGLTYTQLEDIPGIKVTIDTGKEGPSVALIGEMDAVICREHPSSDPKTGAVHACGHNVQVATVIGAALGLLNAQAFEHLSGKIHLIAVPAEEYIEVEYRSKLREQGIIHYLGGKPEFLYRGLFDDVDLSILLHTSTQGKRISLNSSSNGCIVKKIKYAGKPAHAGGAPHKGVNALYAANLGLMGINALRETFVEEEHIRVHPIITKGGDIVNVIPSDVRLETFVRGTTLEAIAKANSAVNRALVGGALALGATVEINDLAGYFPLFVDEKFHALAAEVMQELADPGDIELAPEHSTGSTDMGDLSTIMPVIQPYIGGVEGVGHGADFRLTDPDTAYILGSQFMACTVVELLANGASKAEEIVGCYTPLFPSKDAYFDYADKLFSRKSYCAEDFKL